MKAQVLRNIKLDRLPASKSAIIFTKKIQGSSTSKIKYYVNLKRVDYLTAI